MQKKCVLCEENISEDYGKLMGTVLTTKDETNKKQLIYVCSECQKQDKCIERAMIKGV